MKQFLKAFALGALLVAQPLSATAATSNYFGVDYGAGSGSLLPESNAAAASFDAAARFQQIIDFESLSVGGFANQQIAPGVVAAGGSNTAILNFPINSDSRRSGFNTTAGGANFLQLNGGSITFVFTNPIVGFGAYITGMNANGAAFDFNNGTPQSISTNDLFYAGIFGGAAFVGFLSDTPFSWVTFRTTTELGVGDQVSLDDLRYVNAVPEPTTFGMIGAGLLLLMAARLCSRPSSSRDC